MNLYIAKNGQRLGPYSVEQARDLVKGGTFQNTDLAWHEGISTWIPLRQIPDFAAPQAKAPPLFWFIAIFIALYYAGRALFALYFWAHLFLMFPNTMPTPRMLLSLGLTLTIIFINFIAVILLLLRLRASLYCFACSFAAALFYQAYTAIAFHGMTSMKPYILITLVGGWVINIGVLACLWYFTKKAVLRPIAL